jgi:hypothetical protein
MPRLDLGRAFVVTIFLILCEACSTPPKPLSSPLAAHPEYEQLSINELNELEFKKPNDAALKLALARQYSCGGDFSLAIETWNWIVQFAPETPEARVSLEYLKNLTDHPQSSQQNRSSSERVSKAKSLLNCL